MLKHTQTICRQIADDLLSVFKGCVRYIFASLICMSKREHLWHKEKCLLFHFQSSFRSIKF